MHLSAEERLAAIRRCAAFANVPAQRLAMFAALTETESFGPGQVVFEEGEAADGVYVIARGACQVSSAKRGVIRTMQSGEVLGEYGLFGSGRRLATVLALPEVAGDADERLVLLYTDNDRFRAFLHEYPDVMFGLFAVTVARLEEVRRSQSVP